ncbi:MAG TPA: Rad52/Rad22 family DNA repair protein [Terriglobia bacterium]|nr:Rad52/Rad22 family DNA repair protein [Terriglobia bacterium]
METQVKEHVPSGPGGQPVPSVELRMFSRQEIEQHVERLREPFDPHVVQWVVTATAPGKDGHRRGLLAAYADPRAYMDRLNELFTPSGWTQEYSTQIIPNCPRKVRDKQLASAKLLVICRLTIFGLGAHSGTGEGWADDENALTSADAQAFKRAGVPFGLGRYFYDLPQEWVDLDEHDRPRWLPDLPVWALPRTIRGQATGNGGSSAKNGRGPAGGRPAGNGRGANGHGGAGAAGNGRNQALSEIETLSKQVGRSIFRSTVVSVAGLDNPVQVGDVGKLKEIAERLANAGRGVQRLKAAVGKVGLEALAAACREFKLSSTLTDDIPDTKVLRQLVDRLEQQSQTPPPAKLPSEGVGAPKEIGKNGEKGTTLATDFGGLRNEVLTLARSFASSSKRPIVEVITWASDGAFQYADIGKLTSGDVPKLEVAVRRLREAAGETQSEGRRC